MKFTLSWLKRFLDTEASIETISNTLTMIGLEVEEIEDKSNELSPFEVAQIIETNPHPNADKLKICKVKTADSILQIVCGAVNATPDIKVVLAKVGTLIPNGNFKIKAATIRGVDSCGMLCSAEELGLAKHSDGIIELDTIAKVGDSILSYLGVDDPVFNINITPNRADALGVYGIARDLAAAGIGTLKDLTLPVIIESFSTNYTLSVENTDICPLFAIREIKGLKNQPSPKWLSNLLESVGIGSISAIVDVTNYIAYSFGQPMHAYDASKIDQGLIVKTLSETINLQALNDKEYELTTEDIVIQDHKKTHCLAGIIGSSHSLCTFDTDTILLEAAIFDANYISHTGRRLMIETDSRYRFERNVDQNFTLTALDFASQLITEICGGQTSKVQYIGNNNIPLRIIDFPKDFFHAKTNIALSNDQILTILTNLGFSCVDKGEFINIQIPSWRYDVTIKEDIVEEIVRIHGYDHIPQNSLPANNVPTTIPFTHKRASEIKRLLALSGYHEVVTWSFMDTKKAMHFSQLKDELTLQNPISADLGYMRPSILPNLLQICHNNLNRSLSNLSFFEVGPIFRDTSSIAINNAAGVKIGQIFEKNSHTPTRDYDVFDIKADIATILEYSGIDIDKCQIMQSAPNYYHPTRSASISLGKNILGYFGQIHPQILELYKIEVGVVAFELNMDLLPIPKKKFGKKTAYSISNYQMVKRDYAFVVDQSLPALDLLKFIKNVDPKLVKNVDLFDIYVGEKIDPGKKSLALSLSIQDNYKTLAEHDLLDLNNKIINGAKQRFNATLRNA